MISRVKNTNIFRTHNFSQRVENTDSEDITDLAPEEGLDINKI